MLDASDAALYSLLLQFEECLMRPGFVALDADFSLSDPKFEVVTLPLFSDTPLIDMFFNSAF